VASSDVRIVYSSAGLYTVLQDCIQFCRIVYGSAGLYTVLQDCIQFCRIVYSSAGLYPVLQDCIQFCRISLCGSEVSSVGVQMYVLVLSKAITLRNCT